MRRIPILVLLVASGLVPSTQAHAAFITLDQAFRSALNRSETVGQSRARVEQADERIKQVRGGIFPNLSLNAQHFIQDEPADPIARAFSPQHQTTVNLTVRQPLFRGLREWQGLSQQKHLKVAAEAQQQATLIRLFIDVAGSYLGILSQERELANLEAQRKLYGARLGELRTRVKRGESSASDALTNEAAEAALAAEARIARAQILIARENFNFLTDLPADSELADAAVALEAPAPRLQPLDTYLAKLEERPDVRAARERAEAADKDIAIARGGHLPSLDAVGNYYLKRPGFLSDIAWDIGFQFTLPLFEGLSTQAKVREAAAKRTEADLDLTRIRRAAGQEIRSFHESLAARLEQIEILKRAAGLAERNSEVLQRDYRRGLSRNIDVQSALTDHRAALRGFDRARYTARLELIQLQAAAAWSPPVPQAASAPTSDEGAQP